MLLKTKDRCGKSWNEAGMLLITKEILAESGNIIENKGDRWYVVGGRWGRAGCRWWVGKDVPNLPPLLSYPA
jgi:hypothetical protein